MKVGQKVQWKSHGSGNYTTKEGKIVRVIKLGETPFKVAREEFPNHRAKFDGWNIPGRGKIKQAYFVEIIINQTANPWLYMPHPENLVKI